MLNRNGTVSPIIIPTRHMGQVSDDTSLHKVFISCTRFRGKNNGALHALHQDNQAEQYKGLLLNPDDDFDIPYDFVDIIATTMAEGATSSKSTLGIPNRDLLYLLDYIRLFKV
jgi:hypothetical protein